jgi:diaminohydroxyphosphoribosylaminopyrimidine deaminase/5-amino-6-(5-phosphoribosylamino)uracil reductase
MSGESLADIVFMEQAVALAGRARPSPNPRVGAVVVNNGRVIGTGFHERAGFPHAEIVALQEAGQAAKDSDLYVTLEPCVHFGRTGPCVDAIIQSGVARVFVGLTDPDSRVNGKGVEALRAAKLLVETGILEDKCKSLLAGYITHRTLERPRVTLKAAITIDGYLASLSGNSKWISSPESRVKVHEMRAESDAVLVGVNTVINDDPQLTVRDAGGVSPLRIVLDPTLRVPTTAKLFHCVRDVGVMLVYSRATDESIGKFSKFSHVELLHCTEDCDGRISISDFLKKLGQKGILSLLVEGGRAVLSAFLREETVDEVVLFIAPKILGAGIPWTDYPAAHTIAQGLKLFPTSVTTIGNDILYRAALSPPKQNR